MSNSGMNSLLGMSVRFCAVGRHLYLEAVPKPHPQNRKKSTKQEEILKVLQDKEAGAPGGPEGWEGWCWFPTDVVPSLKIIFSKSTRNTQIASPVAPSLCLFYQ